MLFSQRNNLVQTPTNLKLDEISIELRNSLWNAITEWKHDRNLYDTCYVIWKRYFKLPVDQIPFRRGVTEVSYEPAWDFVRNFFSNAQWNNVYDFIEFLFLIESSDKLAKEIDRILVRELAVYRVSNKQFIPVSSPLELESIENASKSGGEYGNVDEHIKTAIAHLTNRDNPDFRNSVKESISAVEAMAKIITGQPKATLDDALRKLEKDQKLHAALKKSYSALYGYTCEADGIRHSLMEESNLTLADARYFLISCSAFVNYLKTIAI